MTMVLSQSFAGNTDLGISLGKKTVENIVFPALAKIAQEQKAGTIL